MPSMTPETKELFARRYMNLAISEDLVEWAISLLEAEVFTKNLSILASLTTLYPSEVEDYFKRSLKDLGWVVPEREECLNWYIRESAAKILREEITPFDGCRLIYHVLLALDWPGDLSHWSCLYMGHDPSGNYDELSDDKLVAAIRREAGLLIK